MENRKITTIDIIALILLLGLLMFLSLIPFKETISCNNNNCHVRDYSILKTNNANFDLSHIKLYIDQHIMHSVKFSHSEFFIKPISECPYINVERVEKDKEMIESTDNIVLKHISGLYIFTFLFILFYTFFYYKYLFTYTQKKYVKYLMWAVLIRLLYILII